MEGLPPIVLMLMAACLLFPGSDCLPGGLHWENYDYGFYAGLAASGQLTRPSTEFWKAVGPEFATLGLHMAWMTSVNALTGWGWATAGIVKATQLLAVLTVGLTWMMGRVSGGRGTGLFAAVFLLASPAFLLHARAGNLQSILHATLSLLVVLPFMLAHKHRRPVGLLVSAWFLSWSYLGAYISFPVVVLSFILVMMIQRRTWPLSLFMGAWYLGALAVFICSMILNGAVISTWLLHSGPFYLFRAVEFHGVGLFSLVLHLLGNQSDSGALSMPLDGVTQVRNVFWMIRDFFMGAFPAYKSFLPEGPLPVVVPFDHLGSTVPGVPGIHPLMALLMLVGMVRLLRSRRPECLVVAMVWGILLVVVGLVLSYHGRRLTVMMPFAAVAAAWGWEGLCSRWLTGARGWMRHPVGTTLAILLVGWSSYVLLIRHTAHVRTLQVAGYREAGRWILEHLDPKRDVLVLVDKPAFFPTALYAETGFRPYRLMVMSEFYFPELMDATDSGESLWPAGAADFNHAPPSRFYRYTNSFFSVFEEKNIQSTASLSSRTEAFEWFWESVQKELRKGRRIYVLSSPAGWERVEAGDPRFALFAAHEFQRSGVVVRPSVHFPTAGSSGPSLEIFRIEGRR